MFCCLGGSSLPVEGSGLFVDFCFVVFWAGICAAVKAFALHYARCLRLIFFVFVIFCFIVWFYFFLFLSSDFVGVFSHLFTQESYVCN